MAVVTGLTAARMLAIEAASVVGAAVDGSGHLILTRHDASTFDGGVIVGPNAVDIYNTQTVGGQKTFSAKMQINNILVVGTGGPGSTIIAGSNSAATKVPVAEFYKDTGTAGEEANLVIRGNSAAGSGGSVVGGRGVGILFKHSTEASIGESNKHWAITAYSTLAYGNSPNLIFRNGTTGVNPLVIDGVTNEVAASHNFVARGYVLTIGSGGTAANASALVLNGGDAGAGGGGGLIQFYKNSVEKWRFYTLGNTDGNLYIRDIPNAKMVATFKPGGAGASSVDITDKLTIGSTSISAGSGLVGVTAGGAVDDIISWSVADNDGFRIRVGGASNAGYVEFATNDDAAEQIYFRQYSPGWTTAVRTLTLLDSAGDTSIPGQLTAARVSVGFDGGSGVSTNSWFRSSGNTGWYSATYGTGIYSTRAGWIDTYANASLQVNGDLNVVGQATISKSGQGTTNIYPITPNMGKLTASTGAFSAVTTIITTTTVGDGVHSVLIHAHIPGLIFSVGTDKAAWTINANGSAIASGFVWATNSQTGQGNPLVATATHVPAAGSTTTYTLTLARSTGTGTIVAAANASSPGILAVTQLI